jgi:peptide/nickel transport system permease protein
MKFIWASKTATVGLFLVLFWVFVAIFAPLLTPYTPLEQDWKSPNIGPSSANTFWAPMNWDATCGPG